MNVTWKGVYPAITTPFDDAGRVDHDFLAEHSRRLIAAGCSGLIPLGSLGEGATLSFDEKVAVLRTIVGAVGDRVPVIPGIAALATGEAVRLVQAAAEVGCSGLMALPPYVYAADWRELQAHLAAVMTASALPVLLYNNPVAYGADFLPERIAVLAERHPTLAAVKESSGDTRRVTAIRALVGDRLQVLAGLDDGVVEGVMAGASGWVAGLVNALPRESVILFERAVAVRNGTGDPAALAELYHWFLPLLRLDTVPKFVQLIKVAQSMTDMGSTHVRPPRLALTGAELEQVQSVIAGVLATRPRLGD
jgi:dihydrodipicolinate synthase/N-acetylneuraminate lyase